MPVTDPIADLLTRIRNANIAAKEKVEVPASKMKQAIVDILKKEGYIRSYRIVEERGHGMIRIYLKYGPKQEKVITHMERVSKPSVRQYVDKDHIPRAIGGLGICILSTSRGLMTDREARRQGIGGELLCKIW
ncbi:MAG: 30S ribosomal protein S8 [Candidatus Omnitrophota bacterium]|jgi:small subunit ribosomal protein S8|nr:MAG: 30S ribosomal protein S8 [Candidatus Omnitrophota bacterium]